MPSKAAIEEFSGQLFFSWIGLFILLYLEYGLFDDSNLSQLLLVFIINPIVDTSYIALIGLVVYFVSAFEGESELGAACSGLVAIVIVSYVFELFLNIVLIKIFPFLDYIPEGILILVLLVGTSDLLKHYEAKTNE